MTSPSRLLNTLVVSLILLAPSALTAREPASTMTAPAVPATEALARLKTGNTRFASGELTHPRQSVERREALTAGQRPFAVVLACADSRTPPEVLFDQGLGDLFVVRVAGNVLNDDAIGSIEYAVTHLGAQLIVVLGHDQCGAVTAARDTIAAKAKAPGHIQSIVNAIRPAVKSTLGESLDATIRANELDVTRALRSSAPILKEKVKAGTLTVVPANYDLKSGRVEFLEPAK
jgi:carbonic anhydrase